MGAGASAAERRVFCHHCGARTAASIDGDIRCTCCGATDGVEATDQRLPTTGPSVAASSSSSSSALVPSSTTDLSSAGLSLSRAGAAGSSTNFQERSAMRVESVTVVATQRPEDGSLLLRVLPNVVARRENAVAAGEPDEVEATPEPACTAFVSRLRGSPLSDQEAAHGDGVCVICAESIAEAGTPVVVLCCGHRFHDSCIRRWLTRRHTCPTCRFELEVDNVKYLRSIGLAEEADELEKIEQEKQARELQKQTAARRRWVQSMRRGDPVHFGLVCGYCADTPLVGQCFRCTTCEGYILCGDCHVAHEADSSAGRHTSEHSFVEFGMGTGSAHVPRGHGGQLTVLLPAPARPSVEDTGSNVGSTGSEAQADMPGESALAAAEAAFVAVRSLAFAPLAGAGPSLLLNGNNASTAGGTRTAATPAATANGSAAAAAGRGGVRRGG